MAELGVKSKQASFRTQESCTSPLHSLADRIRAELEVKALFLEKR